MLWRRYLHKLDSAVQQADIAGVVQPLT